jgi:hypothetical protein
MARHVVFGGFAAVGAFALVAVFAVTAVAQTAPVRVVQGSDGTLYLVQGGKSWTLIPEQIGDSDLAALTSRGEVDGTVPAQFPASAPPPAAAPASADVDKLVGDYDVNYGAPAVVTLAGSAVSYTVTAKSPVRVTGSHCDLPPGTVIATFSLQSGTSYSGQHGLWSTADCRFVQWTNLSLELKGTILTANFGVESVTYTPSAPDSAAVSDSLTDSMRTDILAAVDRGNAAWTAAQLSLDPADLQSGLTGLELSGDTSQLAQFRSSGQKRKAVNTAFTVLDVTLDTATEATVHTRETWSDDVYSTTTGALIRHDAAVGYSETYTVDLLDGQWTVSQIQLQ